MQRARPNDRGRLVGLVLVICLVIAVCLGLFLVLREPNGDEAGQSSPSPEPSAIPSVEPSPSGAATSSPSGNEPLTEAEAMGVVQDYLAKTPGDPDAGWAMLSPRRQDLEEEGDYRAFWSSTRSASVSGCSWEERRHVLSCQLTTVAADSKATTGPMRFWLTRIAGVAKIDVEGGSSEDQLAAEKKLEEQRQASLKGLNLDGRWVAELSAKRPGIDDPLETAVNGTHVFYFTDILAVHEQMKQRFSGVSILMLRRADFGRQGRDLWFTIADPGGLASKEDVEAWCKTQFPEMSGEALTNRCTPRQMLPPHG